jgi:methionine biosynthesis protein MetW
LDYFAHLRADILDCVPAAASRILSVGCGKGVTEAVLVGRGSDVVGIELNPAAASEARSRGLTVLEGDVSHVAAELAGRTFDCMIFADVLEHIADPVAVLRSHLARLDRRGTVIVSVPNFRNFEVLWQLFIRGHVRYADAGILDRTHLRVTTRRMVEQWYRETDIQKIRVKYRMWRRRETWLSAATLGVLREFIARQVIVVGRKN